MSAERKGFYTSSDYWGWVDGKFVRFPTEAEYLQYLAEREQGSEPEVISA